MKKSMQRGASTFADRRPSAMTRRARSGCGCQLRLTNAPKAQSSPSRRCVLWIANVQPGPAIMGAGVRVRTEDKRQAIISVALEVFREAGYERASMAAISKRLGGSKGTLYGYFRSKEELFEAAMKAASEGPGDQIMALLDTKANDLRAVLKRFARAYLDFILGEEVLRITRTAIAEGSASALGPHLFDQGPGRALTKMANFFGSLSESGKLRAGPSEQAALHFKSLIEAGFLEEALYGAKRHKPDAIATAVDTFLRAYAP
jgi:AcrR family transcriptional regulator